MHEKRIQHNVSPDRWSTGVEPSRSHNASPVSDASEYTVPKINSAGLSAVFLQTMARKRMESGRDIEETDLENEW